jgi:hypothetical protein
VGVEWRRLETNPIPAPKKQKEPPSHLRFLSLEKIAISLLPSKSSTKSKENLPSDCMKLGSGSREKTQMLRNPGNSPDFPPGFSIYPVDSSQAPVFLQYFSWIFAKIDP